MATLRIDESTFVNEREVVKEERRMRVDNQPYGRLNEIIYEQAFTTHPYKHPTIGSMQDLEAASIDDVRDFYNTFYVPANATLVLVGDFDTAQARQLVEQYIGRVPGSDHAGPARHSEGAAADQGTAGHARDALAAAGGRRGAPHHLRRPSGFVSAAHRVEGAVGRAELADLSEAGLRQAARRGRLRRCQSDRRSEPVLRRRHRAARADAGGGGRRAHRRARPPQERSRSASTTCSGPRISSRATTSSGASRTSRRRCSSRTPRSSTTTSPRPTASSRSSRTSRPPTSSASRDLLHRRRTAWC